MHLAPLLTSIEIAATLAFAVSGLIEATRKRMDIVGVFSVTFVSAFAGGTVRDVLLDRRPLFWIQHTEYVWLVLALTLTAPLVLKSRRHQLADKMLEFADALGLGLFAISGASIALVGGMPAIVAVLMGSITAVCGGVVRDLLCAQIPKVYYDHRPYTLCTVVGCVVFLALDALTVSAELASGIGIASTAALRLLAIVYDWRIPAWPPNDSPDAPEG